MSDDPKTTLRGVGDCNVCGWREELGHIRIAIESLDRQLEGVREDYRSFRKARDSVASLTPEQIADSTPPGKREEISLGPVKIRGRRAVAEVIAAVALIVVTALATHTITAEHLSSLVHRSSK